MNIVSSEDKTVVIIDEDKYPKLVYVPEQKIIKFFKNEWESVAVEIHLSGRQARELVYQLRKV